MKHYVGLDVSQDHDPGKDVANALQRGANKGPKHSVIIKCHKPLSFMLLIPETFTLHVQHIFHNFSKGFATVQLLASRKSLTDSFCLLASQVERHRGSSLAVSPSPVCSCT